MIVFYNLMENTTVKKKTNQLYHIIMFIVELNVYQCVNI